MHTADSRPNQPFCGPDPAEAMPAIECAILLAEDGWATFPMNARKRPVCRHGVKDASRDPEAIRRLFSLPGAELVAVATGAPSGVSVLDIDRQHGGIDWWKENRHRMPPTLAWRSRSGGLHVVFQHRPEIRTVVLGEIGRGVEIRATGASAIYWPAQGYPYLCEAPPARWPSWLVPPPRAAYTPPAPAPWCGNDRRARKYAEAALANAIARVATAAPGTRNATLNSQAFALVRLAETGALATGEIVFAMASAAAAAGLDGREVAATLKSALQAGVARR